MKRNSFGMVDIVNNEIVDFFTNEALKFIDSLILTIPNELEKRYAIDLTEFIKNKNSNC